MTNALERDGRRIPQPRTEVGIADLWPYAERRSSIRATGTILYRRATDRQRAVSDECHARASAQRRGLYARVAIDGCVAALGALAIGIVARPVNVPMWALLLFIPAVMGTWLTATALTGCHEMAIRDEPAAEIRGVLLAGIVLFNAAVITAYLSRHVVPGVYLVALAPLTTGLSLLARSGLRMRRRAGQHRALVVGDESQVRYLAERFRPRPQNNLQVVGACTTGGRITGQPLRDGVEVLGSCRDVAAAADSVRADVVVVAPCAEIHGLALRELAWQLEDRHIDLIVAPGVPDVAASRLRIRKASGMSMMQLAPPESCGGRRVLKEVFDRVAATVLLVCLLPLFVLIGLAVRIASPGPAFFRQTRVGQYGREFGLYKFRSMRIDAEAHLDHLAADRPSADGVLFKMAQDPRVTTVGAVLRRYSLDELPQLLNVILGHMSLVGPRPSLPREVRKYGYGVNRRLLVKPGITGLWQVSGRSDLPWQEAVRLDLSYVENWSFGLDVRILARTLAAVARGNGAY